MRVHPNAATSEVTALVDGVLQDKVAAPPVEGRANRELIDFLSRRLGVAKSRLAVVRGYTARDKVVAVIDLSREKIMSRLAPHP